MTLLKSNKCSLQADIDPTKRAGELSEEEVDKIVTIMQNPRQYKIPDWFLNRQKDIKDGKNMFDYKHHFRILFPGPGFLS